MDPKDISIESLGIWKMSSKDMRDLYVYWPDSVTQKKNRTSSQKSHDFRLVNITGILILIGGFFLSPKFLPSKDSWHGLEPNPLDFHRQGTCFAIPSAANRPKLQGVFFARKNWGFGCFHQKLNRDLTNGPLRRLLELLNTQV